MRSEYKGYPSDFVSPEEKASPSWGLKYLKRMYTSAKENGDNSSIHNRAERIKELRRYAEGSQSIEKFKSQMTSDGSSTYLNIDWNVAKATPLSKMVSTIVGKIINQTYKPKAVPVDSLSVSEVDKYRRELFAKMAEREIAPIIEKATGNKMPQSGYVPEDTDELEIHMQTTYKQSRAMAMDEIIDYQFAINDFKQIEERIAKDAVVIKQFGTKSYYDKANRVRLRYVDPLNLITSFVKERNFADATHIGEIVSIPISKLRVEAQGYISEKDLYEIAKSVGGKYGNDAWQWGSKGYYELENSGTYPYDSFMVKVLDAEVKSVNRRVYQKKDSRGGGYYFEQKEYGYEKPKRSKKKIELKQIDVEDIYEGKYIIDTDYIYGWKKRENILRRRINGALDTSAMFSYTIYAPDIYDMQNKSIVEQMMGYSDKISLAILKMQHLLAKASPPGYIIDISSIKSLMNGLGGADGFQKLTQIRSFIDSTGDFYYDSVREDGTPITNTRPVEFKDMGVSKDLERIANLIEFEVNNMREVAGLPLQADSSSPDEKSLVGTTKLAMNNHNDAMRTINNSYLSCIRDTAEKACLMSQDLIKNKVNVKDFEVALGKSTVDAFDISDLSDRDFGIIIEMLPSEEEIERLNVDIERAISSGQLPIEDAITLRRVAKESIEKAEQLFILKSRRRKKEAQKQAEANSKMNAEQQVISAQAKAEAEMQKEKARAEREKDVFREEYSLKTKYMMLEQEEQRKTKALENSYDLEKIKLNAILKEEKGIDIQEDVMVPKVGGDVEPDMPPSP